MRPLKPFGSDAVIVKLEARYSPDQPRYEKGRFGEGSGENKGKADKEVHQHIGNATTEPKLEGFPSGQPTGMGAGNDPKVVAGFNSALSQAYENSPSLYRGASWSGAIKTLDGLKDGKIQSGGWIMGEREAEEEPSDTVSFTLSPTVASTFGANSGRHAHTREMNLWGKMPCPRTTNCISPGKGYGGTFVGREPSTGWSTKRLHRRQRLGPLRFGLRPGRSRYRHAGSPQGELSRLAHGRRERPLVVQSQSDANRSGGRGGARHVERGMGEENPSAPVSETAAQHYVHTREMDVYGKCHITAIVKWTQSVTHVCNLLIHRFLGLIALDLL